MAQILVMRPRGRRRRMEMRAMRVEDAQMAQRNREMELKEPVGFFVTHRETGMVLTIKNAKNEPGVKVVLSDKDSLIDGRFHQLWFPDKQGVLHSKMNDYALDVADEKSKVVVGVYDSTRTSQQWILSEREGFVNQSLPGLRITYKSGCCVCSHDVIARVTPEEYEWEITKVA